MVKQAWETLHAVSFFEGIPCNEPIKNSDKFSCKETNPLCLVQCLTNLRPHGAVSLFMEYLITSCRTVFQGLPG